MTHSAIRWALASAVITAPFPLLAAESGSLYLEIEAGPAWVSRNNVRIPTDDGTRFDMIDLTGNGPDLYGRIYATYAFNERHSLRMNLAPLQFSGTGTFEEAVRFQDSDFIAGEPVRGNYRFNTYRLTYRWLFHSDARWDLGVGGALLVRDAKIELTQGDTTDLDDDVGVVPLLHLYAAYRINERMSLVVDLEGAGAAQGRAIDVSFKAHYDLGDGWDVSLGYRTLEGGADNDSLYNFAWINYAALGVGYRFP